MEEPQLREMLLSTMAPRDTATFQETGDVDYAYALESVARFRCNAAVDRLGPMGVFRIVPSRIPTCDELDLSQPIRNLCSLTKGYGGGHGPDWLG
jgi:twitching motility protein PilT